MDLPFTPHFAIVCSCGGAWCSLPLSAKQHEIARQSPTEGLRVLAAEDQASATRFYADHHDRGHSPEPKLLGIAPMPTA